MRSPISALAWEVWRRGRLCAGLAFGCLVAAALVNLILKWTGADSERVTDYTPLFGLLMTLSFLFLLGALNYTETAPAKEWNGFPYRLFVLPAPTWKLVLLPSVLAVVLVEAVYLGWIKLVWTHGQILAPEWFAAVLGAWTILYQATLWTMAGFRLARVIALALGGVSSIAVACLPFSQAVRSPWLEERRLIPLMIGIAVAAWLAAWLMVARQRSGGGRRRDFAGMISDCILDVLPRRRKNFGSPAAAQFWFEWRRAGWVLPACTGFVLVIIAVFNQRDATYTDFVLVRLPAIPLALAFVIGKAFVKGEFWAANLDFPQFVALRPQSQGEIVIAKMRVAAVSAALAWALVLGFLALWLPFMAETSGLERLFFEFRIFYPRAWLPILVLSLPCLAVATWRMLVSGFWSGLSGSRFRYLGSIGLQVVLPVLFLVAAGIWSDAFDDLLQSRPDLLKPALMRIAGWLLAALVIGKLWAAAIAWSRINPVRSKTYLALWSGATLVAVLLALLSAPPLDTFRVEHLVVLAALLVCPLARLGLAPSALAKNLHR